MNQATIVRARGFTFIELLMTLAVLGILALMAVPMAQATIQRQKEQELRSALLQIREAIDAFKRAAERGHLTLTVGESGYPRSLDELADGVDDQRSPARRKLYFLRRIPRDPFAPDTVGPAARSWGLRSYASPPDNPSAGADVFDVYSTSPRVGSNGVPYGKW